MNVEITFKQVKNLNNIPVRGHASALVLALQEKNARAHYAASLNPKKVFSPLLDLLSNEASFCGKAKTSLFFRSNPSVNKISPCYKDALVLGIGTAGDFTPRSFLQWGGSLANAMRKNSVEVVDVFLDSFFFPPASTGAKNAPKDFAKRKALVRVPSRQEQLEKLIIGIILSSYRFDRYKTKKAKKESVLKLRFISQKITDLAAKKIILQAYSIAESINFTRDLQNIPGNDLYPEKLQKEIAKDAKKSGFKVRAFEEKKLKSLGMEGILTVGRGSSHDSRLIILEHNADKKKLPTVVVVGKGVTFDTGGISLKPPAKMDEMKMDMSGAAATVGILRAASLLKLPLRVIGLIPAAENKPGADSVNPGDVYTSYSGKTVEVLNTDAEGRLVLADALSYAAELKPDCVFDIATLTGAVCVALGCPATGVMGNHSGFIDSYKDMARLSGEEAWELPLYPYYENDLKSKVADLQNIGTSREGGAQKAGAFLNCFVEGQYPWIHLDVASTAMTVLPGDDHQRNGFGTGIPVGSVVEFLRNFKKSRFL